jgi:amphi-Trp domain-containing protein
VSRCAVARGDEEAPATVVPTWRPWSTAPPWEEVEMAKPERDVERIYKTEDVVAKLRRLADALESGSSFRIQIAGERFRVPARAEFSIEHERGEDEEEVEFQLKWSLDGDADDDEAETVV